MQIHELRLATTAVEAQHAFYRDTLGLPIFQHTSGQTGFQAGATRLIFEQSNLPLAGVYHFAFNIPTNQFEAAQTWITARVPLLADETGNTVFHSEAWNADMLYFADPAGNIVELIARHTLANTSTAPFGTQSILNISEIGIATADVAAQVATLQAQLGVDVYQGVGHPMFTPVGDENGLLIVVGRGRIWFPDTGKPAEHVPIHAVVQGQKGVVNLAFP